MSEWAVEVLATAGRSAPMLPSVCRPPAGRSAIFHVLKLCVVAVVDFFLFNIGDNIDGFRWYSNIGGLCHKQNQKGKF